MPNTVGAWVIADAGDLQRGAPTKALKRGERLCDALIFPLPTDFCNKALQDSTILPLPDGLASGRREYALSFSVCRRVKGRYPIYTSA